MLEKLRKYWYLFVLVLILLFSYSIRAQNIVPDRLLSFDPIFQYRFTKYFADYGTIPVWDELSYYVGRKSEPLPLMFYITSIVYWITNVFTKISLVTVSSYMSAVYGALIVIPAFLVGRELSNKYGGLLTAILIGTAPQILVRTFGSSYDTDQLVVFFIILTIYLGFRLIRRKDVTSLCLALIGFISFSLVWTYFLYPLIIVLISIFINILLSILKSKPKEDFVKKITSSIKDNLNRFFVLIVLFVILGIANFIVIGTNIVTSLSVLIGFAQKAEQWIVNISIAELQPFDIFSLEGLITAMGRFFTGDMIINTITFLFLISMIIAGIYKSFKKDLIITSFLITLFLIAIYSSSRGIRFTEFTSSLFLILIGAGFGIVTESLEKDVIKKTIVIGFAVFVALVAMSIGSELSKQLGPDINASWDNAWNFLKTKTPELSIVGTWWDPGHMINGLAERRNYADGAHCQLGFDGKPACLYTINDRITDLGKIMATADENESLKLIRKYQGDSPKVYWIASDDLIGKFQWLQYFGTGCDARVDQRCPLYIQIPEQSRSTDQNGNIVLRNYGSVVIFEGLGIPVPIYIQDINGALFDEVIYYSQGNLTSYKLNETEEQSLIQTLKPLESQLNFRFTNQSIPLTVWIPESYSYMIIIHQNLRNNVFTKMFMLEGQGLDHFKQVFRNEQVKIYEVI
jgi:asparagine N-glycosylation enzyme membrane subunit Stt3